MHRNIYTNILRPVKELPLVVGMKEFKAPLSAFCCILLQPLWPISSKPKILSLAKVITTNVELKDMAELEGNIQKYAEGGSVTA